MNRSTLFAPPRRGLAALALVGLLVSFQPVAPAAGGSGATPATTRLRPRQVPGETQSFTAAAPAPSRLDASRDRQLRQLLSDVAAGKPFSLEEYELLNHFAFGGELTELEADVLLSRVLYDRYVVKRPLTREQELLLEAYEEATARRERAILDSKREILEREELEAATAPRAPQIAPVNDTCAGAIAINGPLPACSPVEPDVTDATTTGDPGFPSCAGSVTRSIWYTFTPAMTDFYRITTCADQGAATTLGDPVMAIYTSANGCVGPFTEVPTGGFTDGCDDDSCVMAAAQATISTRLMGGTTYYIVVWKFGFDPPPGAGLTAVQVCISTTAAPAVPANDTCAGATPLTVNVPVTGTNGPVAANDYELLAMSPCFPAGQTTSSVSGRDVVYSFTAPATSTYSFRVLNYVPIDAAGGRSNLVIYLASACPAATPGTPVAVTCTAASNQSLSSSGAQADEITCVALTAGQTVFLFIDENVPGAGGTFNVLAEECGNSESEPNDTPATADAFACGIIGSVSPATDTDFYSLGTPAFGSLVFAATDASTAVPSQDIDLRVNTTTDTLEYDDANNGALLGGAAGNVAGTFATGAPLYLQVDRSGTSPTTTSSPYRLYAVVQPGLGSATSESEPNDTPATADAAVNNYFYGTLAAPEPSTDVDVYGFQATTGDLVFISLDGDPPPDATPVNARIDVTDAAGNILFTGNDEGSSTSTASGAGSLIATTPNAPAEAIVFRASVTTNYYVRVSAGSTSPPAAGDYLLSISRNCQTGGGGLGGSGTDTVGIYGTASGAFFLKNANASGAADTVFTFGAGGTNVIPLTGDWDGDGDDTAGIYDTTTGAFFLRNANSNGGADIVLTFGPGGANFVPLSGDWDGDGDDTVGIYDTTTGAFFLRHTNTNGGADVVLTFGPGGVTFIPLTGDWDGDGDDTVGIYDTTSGAFFLRNTNTNGGADLVFTFGAGGAGVDPLAGDWDGDGDDTVGIHIESSGAFFLRNTNASGGADLVFGFGAGGSGFVPVTGDWDGT
jgi:hypothetical protein